MLNISGNKEYIKLEDYKSFDYEIPNIFLDFIIEDTRVIVKTELKLIKKNINNNSLILDGVDIFVEKIYLDESLLIETNYSIQKNRLLIKSILKDLSLIHI